MAVVSRGGGRGRVAVPHTEVIRASHIPLGPDNYSRTERVKFNVSYMSRLCFELGNKMDV